jgi:hypothetical protein
MKYRLAGLCIGLFCLGIAAACGGSNGNNGEPVAIVNGEEITVQELETQLDQMEAGYAMQGMPFPQGEELERIRLQVVEQMVLQRLVIQESDARNIVATDEEVRQQYQAAAASFPDEAAFQEALEAEGLSEADLEELIEDSIRVEKLLTEVVEEAGIAPATEQELRDFYDLISAQQDLPPFEEIEEQLAFELMDQRQNEVIQAFIQDLEDRSEVEILL